MNALVGYTGFVGSNICAAGSFDSLYNSKNIQEAFGTNPDLLIYSGLRAEKFLANNAPEKDMELIVEAEENIRRINPKKLVLISTIDVFKDPRNCDEDSAIDTENLHAYGYNRYRLECFVREKYRDALIVRLPGLFGINIKKNFIFDMIRIIPSMLKKEKMDELCKIDPVIMNFYTMQDNGFYKVNALQKSEEALLKERFLNLGFSALNFTDSRSTYQFYPLARLWNDIRIALKRNIQMLHPATEPVSASELYSFVTGKEFKNEVAKSPAMYDYKTKYAELFGGTCGYICNKAEILNSIKEFINQNV